MTDPTAASHSQACEEAIQRGELTAALDLANKANEAAETEHREALLRIARIHAAQGHREKALRTLWEAVDAGYWDVMALREDPAFEAYRHEPAFQAIARASWAKGYLAMLERDERESFQRKDEVLRALDFRPGERVADIGAGSGYFTIPIAHAVAPGGIVWAVDFVQEMLDFIGRRIAIEDAPNIRLVRTPREEPFPPEGNLDTILLSDVLHYIPVRVPLLQKLKEYLRPGGRMVVLDFTPKTMEERPWGPAPEQQVSQETIEQEMAEAGLLFSASFDFLPEQHFTIHVRG